MIRKWYKSLHEKKSIEIYGLLDAQKENNQIEIQLFRNKLKSSTLKLEKINEDVKEIVKKNNPDAETNDKDYIFMSYVIDYLPHGIIGLLFAVMFSAAMSSTASELNALASTTTIDIYKRSIKKSKEDSHYLKSSKYFTYCGNISNLILITIF